VKIILTDILNNTLNSAGRGTVGKYYGFAWL